MKYKIVKKSSALIPCATTGLPNNWAVEYEI